ncbi:hypothetical protein DdX_20544 [Ditylenchus destructor]|uniref:F-box domain-containing protein n=1 Tax=Ditylenchus destructor TaxID=166010 RepID=A0AAD4QWA2_9BILA|nr:hypothetical protein DdX_20544 [Ditylenchus destructor]
MTNIDALDNYIMVKVFKYLDYYELAKSSRVSTRFRSIICTHRKSLARLRVDRISMSWDRHSSEKDPAASYHSADIKIFNKKFSPEAYNEWIIRNQYSQQISLEGQTAEEQKTKDDRNVYMLIAAADYKSNGFVFYAEVELTHENWPLFQHFARLITDPFLDISWIELAPQNDVLNLLEISLDHKHLKCDWMPFLVDSKIFVNSDTGKQNLLAKNWH